MTIETLSPERFRACLPDLAALLKDAVDGGASVNFVAPFTLEAAAAFWASLESAVSSGQRIVLAAWDGEALIGCVMLALATQPNGLHRAEVQKMLVHSTARGNGYGKALMAAVEQCAKDAGRTLIVLDTECGSVAERLYERVGYTRAGVIPNFATNTEGDLRDAVVFYRFVGLER